MNKLFLKCELHCLSPLSIGSGFNDFTDIDVLLDSDGKPFIPGTSLAGVCRHFLDERGIKTDSLFGTLQNDAESRIIFYDATPCGNFSRSFRDSVKIGNDGTAEDGAKFDFETIEAIDEKSHFVFRIEVDDVSDDDENAIKTIISGFNSGEIRLGHKSNRGYGRMKLENVRSRKIVDINDLIDFEWESVTESFSCDVKNIDNVKKYEIENKAFLFIADYSYYGDSTASSLRNVNGKAVIPGTAWAGIFRSHFSRILKDAKYEDADEFIESLFGYVKGNDAQPSKIVFDETVLNGAKFIERTRNAIDRFTGGAADKKLYTGKFAYGGKGSLVITLKSGNYDRAIAEKLIDLTVADFNDGYLNVGGIGSVGGGLINVKEVQNDG